MGAMTISQNSDIDDVKGALNNAKIRTHLRQMIFKALRQLPDKSGAALATERCLESVA
jgi:hypothetical protein